MPAPLGEFWERLDAVLSLQPWWRMLTLGLTLGSLGTLLVWMRAEAARARRIRDELRRAVRDSVDERL
jgi:sulfite exporter TauE/SafE